MEWKRPALLSRVTPDVATRSPFAVAWPILATLPHDEFLAPPATRPWPVAPQPCAPQPDQQARRADGAIDWLTTRRPTERNIVVQELTGPAGVGKTHTVARYFHGDRAAPTRVWVDAAYDQSAEHAVATAARNLDACGTGWLLVIDDLAGDAPLHHLPRRGPGQVIITRRYGYRASPGDVCQLIALSDQAGEAFLRARSKLAHDGLGAVLSRAAGGLPLPLSLMSALLRGVDGHSAAGLLAELGAGGNHRTATIDRLVVLALAKAASRASDQATSGDHRVLAAMLLAVSPLPLDQQWIADAAPPEFARNPARVGDALESLRHFGLAERYGKFWRLPRPLTAAVRRSLEPTDLRTGAKALGDVLTKQWLAAEGHATPQASPDLSPDSQGDRRVTDPEPGSPLAPADGTDSVAAAVIAALDMLPDAVIDLIEAVSRRADQCGDEHTRLRLRRSIAQRRIGMDGPAALSSLEAAQRRVLSSASAGELREALNIGQWLAASQGLCLGPRHPDTLRTLAALVACLLHSGDAEEAVRVARIVERAWCEEMGEHDDHTLRAGADLAAALVQQGGLHEASMLARSVLAERRRVWGDAHSETLAAAAVVAEVTLAQGNVEEAAQILRWVEPGLRSRFGVGHPRFGAVGVLAALVLRAEEDISGGIELCERIAV